MMEGDGEGSGCAEEYWVQNSFSPWRISLLAECEYFSLQLAIFLASLYNDNLRHSRKGLGSQPIKAR